MPQEVFQSERWDGSNGVAPDDMTYELPVEAGSRALVNLFMANGWPTSGVVGGRLFDVYVEGVLVLDEIDLTLTFGHATGGMFAFDVVDDGDGVITVVLEHGTGPQNPLVNAIEVKNLVTAGAGVSGEDTFYLVEVTNPGANVEDATITQVTDTVNGGSPLVLSCPDVVGVVAPGVTVSCEFSTVHTTVTGEDFTDVVDVTGTFPSGSADASSNPVVVSVPVPVDDPPAAPTGLTAVAGISVVELDWDDNTEPDFGSYSVYRSEASGTDTDDVEVATGLTSSAFTDTTVSNGVEYFYVVVAVDDPGGNVSGTSGEASDTTFDTIRINAGGGELAALDAGPVWEADTQTANHRFLTLTGNNATSNGDADPAATVDPLVPPGVFLPERWSSSLFGYDIPVASGVTVNIRVFMASDYDTPPGGEDRVFDVEVDGVVQINDISLNTAPYVHNFGYEFAIPAILSDGNIDIDFIPNIGNPLVNAIEITLNP